MSTSDIRVWPADPPGSGDHVTAIQVLLCDGYEIYRAGLRALLGLDPAFLVVGEGVDLPTALSLASRLQPDVVVVAADLPEGGALPLLQKLRGTSTQIVLISESGDAAEALAALDAGAMGFLLRRRAPHQLTDALRAALAGELSIDSSLAAPLVEHCRARISTTVTAQMDEGTAVDSMMQLTRRQRQVVLLIAEGLSNAEIAARLTLSVATIKSHVRSAMRQMGARDRTQLAIRAYGKEPGDLPSPRSGAGPGR